MRWTGYVSTTFFYRDIISDAPEVMVWCQWVTKLTLALERHGRVDLEVRFDG